MASQSPLYEIVCGQIRLGKREDFLRLHRETLSPMMVRAGIKPELLLFIDLGRYHRFIDIYTYPAWEDYKSRTDLLLKEPGLNDYYTQVGQCVEGGITVELASGFPHFVGRPLQG
jgi:hypothetical protein